MTLNTIFITVLWLIPMIVLLVMGQWGLYKVDTLTITNYSNIITFLSSALASVLCFWTAKVFNAYDLNRKAWNFIGLAAAIWSIGQLLLGFYEGLIPMDDASIASLNNVSDIFFMVSIIVAIIGFVQLGNSLKIKIPAYSWILGIAMFLGAAAFSAITNWNTIFPTDQTKVLATDRLIFAILYATLYPVLLGFAVTMVSIIFTGMLGRPWIFVLLGFITYSIGEIIWTFMTTNGLYVYGGYYDLLWLVGFMLIGIGAVINYYMIKKPY